MIEIQTLYQEAIKFATYKHLEEGQKVKGTNLPYVVHLSNVAMEIFVAASHTDHFNLSYAVTVALLHDTIEDTSTTYEEIIEHFGKDIADAVLALTKNDELPKELQIAENLVRIKKLPLEIWAVKLADRITNLQSPPSEWDKQKRIQYREDASLILEKLKSGNPYLANRLKVKIEEYGKYLL